MFNKEDKVFSLSKTTLMVPSTNIGQLFEELMCYLVVTGFYIEGSDPREVNLARRMSHADFELPYGNYHCNFSNALVTGLKTRFKALIDHPDINDVEVGFLSKLDGLFDYKSPTYQALSADTFIHIAKTREFSEDMTHIASYAGLMFGQTYSFERISLPKIYLSLFGNIHLTKDQMVFTTPSLIYGTGYKDYNTVTPLYVLLSSAIEYFAGKPGSMWEFIEFCKGFQFIARDVNWGSSVSLPRLCAIAYLKTIALPEVPRRLNVAVYAYSNFLFDTPNEVQLVRLGLFRKVINDMAKALGGISTYTLLEDDPILRQFMNSNKIGKSIPRVPSILQFALEALDTKPKGDDKEIDALMDEDWGDDDTGQKAQNTDDMAQDSKSQDTTVTSQVSPDPSEEGGKDTIGLISFDKTGEGIDEDLYRSAVLVLNDRLKNDDSVPVTADVKDALNYWVNGFLYRTSIKATQDQIQNLKLTKYFKSVATKG